MVYNNYMLSNGLPVHAVYVNRSDEDGKVQQDHFRGTAEQVGDPSQVYVRIDIDVLQSMFQGLHYGKEMVDELSRCKRRRTAAEKKEKAREEQLERQRQDQSTQQWNGVEWEQARIDLWRQKLEERELAVAAGESTVFQYELEYRRLERCPLYGRRGQGDDARGRQAGENDAAHRGNERRRRRVIVRRTIGRSASARTVEERRDEPEDHSRAGQLIQQALGREAEQASGNGRMESWE